MSTSDKLPLSFEENLRENFRDDEIHNHVDEREYVIEKSIIGSLLPNLPANSLIADYFDEIRECFALGRYRACVALCRAMLEIAVYQALLRRGLRKPYKSLNRNERDKLSRQYDLSQMIEEAFDRRLLDQRLKTRASRVRKDARAILHVLTTFDDPGEIDREVAMTSVRTARDVVEALQVKLEGPIRS